ncbi:MAG: serine/threonine-protein kinase, partial [Planctomycetota bacterium]
MVESSSSSDRVSGSSGGGPVSDEELFDLYLEGALAGETREPREFLEDHGRSGASELVGRLEQIREMAATSQVERSAADGLPFARLGEFRLIDRLGQGAMGVVYLAEQTSLGRLVALKVLRSELIGGGPAERRFEHEARALAKIEHPGVVRLYGFGVDQGRRFLAMELVPGESLDEKIEREGSLSPVQAARWGLELARALDRVHGVGLLHRDVKPSNIRIHEDGRAILVDFGLSKGAGAESARRTAGFVGSVGYASPEQVRGNVELDARADVYSLGATLYHVLAGRPPFDGDELEPVLHAILKSDLPALQRIAPAVPRDLATVVACAMERDARRRYASAAALAADLEAVLALRPISARPPSAIEIAIKWLRRNRAAAVALAVALSALLALAAVLALQGRWERERVRSEARAALERARTAVEQHRVDREAMTQLDSELAMLAINTEHGHMRASERRRYWELVDEVEAARRRRAGVGFVVMDALARAVRLDDGLGDDASEVRAALLREQWADALASGEAAELRALELELSALDSTQGSERLPAHPVQVVAEPATRSWLFRLEELGVHDPKAVPRQVPVPVSLDGRTVLEAPVGPGTWVLRAARPSPEIGPLERVVSVDGYALEGGPLVR